MDCKRRAIFVRAKVCNVLKMYEPEPRSGCLDPGPATCARSFPKRKDDGRGAYVSSDHWHTRCQETTETRRVDRVNRVRLKDCGEWKLWGRRPLAIEKQAVALSGERS